MYQNQTCRQGKGQGRLNKGENFIEFTANDKYEVINLDAFRIVANLDLALRNEMTNVQHFEGEE
jgi:hypothetical protein